jgi:hypothetical protein
MRRTMHPATGHPAEPSLGSSSDPQVPDSTSHSQGKQAGVKKRKGGSVFVYIAFLPAVAFLVILHNMWHPSPAPMDNTAIDTPLVPKVVAGIGNGSVEKQPSVLRPKVTPVVTAADGSLPLAKSLLTKPPPFQDSQMIQLSDQLITSPNTVVTAYYRVPSKFKAGKYDEWMKNMLSLQDAMVIFTSQDLVPQIKELRSHALNRTVIIPLALDDLPIGTVFSPDFWQDQLDRDPEKNRHKSYQLFWIWLSKSWCTTQAIRLNVFQSDLFMWSDIGCFRDPRYNYKTMIQHRDQIPRQEMIQMSHHAPNPPDAKFWNDKYQFKANFYHSGSQMAAYADTWKTFHEYFLDTIDGFVERKMIIVEDQAVLQSVCLRYPEICAYVPFDQVKSHDNHYFGLRYVTHNGGNFKLWRHPKALEAKANQR